MKIHKRLKKALILLLFLSPLPVVFTLTLPASTPNQSIIKEHFCSTTPIVHAQLSDPETGCASCHSQPIVNGDCTQCHSSPPTTIDGIFFPHHDPSFSGPHNCQSGNCHNAGNDARYVEEPEPSHNYCGQCHEFKHSMP